MIRECMEQERGVIIKGYRISDAKSSLKREMAILVELTKAHQERAGVAEYIPQLCTVLDSMLNIAEYYLTERQDPTRAEKYLSNAMKTGLIEDLMSEAELLPLHRHYQVRIRAVQNLSILSERDTWLSLSPSKLELMEKNAAFILQHWPEFAARADKYVRLPYLVYLLFLTLIPAKDTQRIKAICLLLADCLAQEFGINPKEIKSANDLSEYFRKVQWHRYRKVFIMMAFTCCSLHFFASSLKTLRKKEFLKYINQLKESFSQSKAIAKLLEHINTLEARMVAYLEGQPDPFGKLPTQPNDELNDMSLSSISELDVVGLQKQAMRLEKKLQEYKKHPDKHTAINSLLEKKKPESFLSSWTKLQLKRPGERPGQSQRRASSAKRLEFIGGKVGLR